MCLLARLTHLIFFYNTTNVNGNLKCLGIHQTEILYCLWLNIHMYLKYI